MELEVASQLISGTSTAAVTTHGILSALAMQTNAASGILGTLRGLYQGVVPVLYPAGMAVVILFGGYSLLKGWYHRHF